MFGVSHSKRHRIDSTKDHSPYPGDHDEDAVVVMDANGLPVKDSGIPLSSLVSGLKPKGEWDASGGTYPTPDNIGDFWWISVAGTIGGVNYEVNDWLVYVDDSPDTWKKIDNSTLVTSVEGRTGAVTLHDIYPRISKIWAKFAAESLSSTPPVSPADDTYWLIAFNPTGIWAGKGGQVGYYKDGAWSYIVPILQHDIWSSKQEQNLYYSNGTGWSLLWTLVSWANIQNKPTGNPGSYTRPKTLMISQDFGSDTLGDGWYHQYATIQKAIDVAVSNLWTQVDIIADSSVVSQSFTVPANMTLTIFGASDLFGSPFYTITSATLNSDSVLALNNISADTIQGVIDGTGATVVLEESSLDTLSNRTGIKLALSNSWLVGDATKWNAILSTLAYWAGIYSFITSGIPTQTKYVSGLNLRAFQIKDVADPTSAQDAATKNYVDSKPSNTLQADIILAGEDPDDGDVITWSDGDRGHGIGTTGREFYMVKRGTSVKYVELV